MSKLAESLMNQGLISQDEAKISDTASYDDGAGGVFTDADTIKRDGITYRLTGFDAREVDKFYDGKFQAGDIGGAEQTIAVADLARKHGFNQLVDTGRTDPYGRTVADLQNAHGESLSHRLQTSGLVQNPDVYRDQDTQAAASFAHLAKQARAAAGEESDWDIAASWVGEAIDEQTQYQPQFKNVALDERQLAEIKASGNKRLMDSYISDSVQFRSPDRHLNNMSRNPLSTSWDIGVKGAIEGLTGTLEMIGQETGWDGLEHWAEGRLADQRYDLRNAPKVLTEFQDIDGVGDFVQYVGNLAAMSLPYMAVTAGAALAAPITGGVSLAAPAAVYGGQVWNEMGDFEQEDRNPYLAVTAGISMAVLDRLGIQGLTNTALLTTAGRNEIVENLVKQGMSREIAEGTLVNATRLEAAKLSGDAVKFSKELLDKKNVAMNLLKSATAGSVGEGVTEAAQETVAALAAHAGSGKSAAEFDWDDFSNRIQQAAIGGATLGGAFSIPGTAYDVGQWTDVNVRQAPADTAKQSRQSRWREQEIKETGKVRSIAELQAEAARAADEKGPSLDLTARAERDTSRSRAGGERFQELIEGVPGLWRGITRHIFTDEIQDRSPAARQLADMFGGNQEQIHSGDTYENAKILRLAKYKNMVDAPAKILSRVGITGFKGEAQRKFSNLMYDAYADARNADGTVDWGRLKGNPKYDAHLDAIRDYANQLEGMSVKMWQDQKAHNPELGFIEGYAFRHRAVDKAKVEQNRQGFINDIVSRFGISEAQAKELTDNILNTADVNSIDEAFSVTEQGGFRPGSHQKRTLNLSDDPQFAAAWLSDNIFYNTSAAAKSAARYTTFQDYIGEGNKKVNELFQQMEDELKDAGMTDKQAADRVNKMARMFRDYLDAESGNYKRPQTDLGRNLQKIQKSLMFYTTIAGLPLATVSSLVEFALVTRNMNPTAINDISRVTKDFAEAFWADTNKAHDRTEGRKALRETGFFEWEVGAATVVGATEQTHSKQRALEIFFQAIGLSQWTDFTRSLRASFAMDHIANQMDLINSIDGDFTNEQLIARDGLANIGINVPRFTELWNKMNDGPLNEAEGTEMQDMIRTATLNWVNDAIALPQAANRPLFYQNPNLALFTQFHGFISTFTAHILPKLYKDVYKNRTPSMRYTAFATLATMVALGFLSQYLKDLLKYGKVPEYLDQGDLIQRGVGASGIAGTGERVYNLFNPIYGKRYDTSIEKVFGELAGESAAITNLQKGVDAVGSAIEGDAERAFRKGQKLIPLFGQTPAINQFLKENIEEIF